MSPLILVLLLFSSPADRFFQEVDARNFVASAGEKKSVVTRSAASIEDRTNDLIGHVNERLLRFANVPRGLAGIDILKSLTSRRRLTCA